MMRVMLCHYERLLNHARNVADAGMYNKDDSNTTHPLSNRRIYRSCHQHAYTASLDYLLRYIYLGCLHNGPSSAGSEQVDLPAFDLPAFDFSAFNFSVSSRSKLLFKHATSHRLSSFIV